jgi:hypothetical protein
MGFLDILLDRHPPPRSRMRPEDDDLKDVVGLTDRVYDLLYNRSYAERCQREGQIACSAWLHAQIDGLGVARMHHERLVILAKFRNGDRSFRDLPKA